MNASSVFLDKTSAEQIEGLRIQEYARAKGFVVSPQSLKWKESDDQSYIMGIVENDRLLSTMRGEIITNQDLLEKKLECPWSFPLHLNYPILLLSRAATSNEHRSFGLNLVLRYWFLLLAKHHSIPFVLGTFIAGSPRENTLREMGYRFFYNELGWQQSTYRSLNPVQVVALDMNVDGDRAISFCREKVADSIERFQLKESFPEFRAVRCL